MDSLGLFAAFLNLASSFLLVYFIFINWICLYLCDTVFTFCILSQVMREWKTIGEWWKHGGWSRHLFCVLCGHRLFHTAPSVPHYASTSHTCHHQLLNFIDILL